MHKEGDTLMKKIMLLVILCSFFGLAACTNRNTMYEMEPVGVGKDPSELKKSPCACTKIELKPGLPEWFGAETV